MAITVLMTAPDLGAAGKQLLAEAGADVIYLPQDGDAATVAAVLSTAPVDAVISRTVPLTGDAIRGARQLRVISKHGVGVSNIDVDAATSRGIPVHVTPGANAQSVAELSVALMFDAARRVSWMDAEIRAGRWSRLQDGIELNGKTLGLVGAGQIGQKVARVAAAVGMRVLAFDPALGDVAPVPEITMVPTLDALLPRADVLSLHVPLTPGTRGLIGAAQLDAMPFGAILLNTARGEVVDEPALVDALRRGRLAAAGLDTTWDEPIARSNPLLDLPNVVLTPHVGGSTPAALEAMARAAAENVLAVLHGERPASAAVNARSLTEETA